MVITASGGQVYSHKEPDKKATPHCIEQVVPSSYDEMNFQDGMIDVHTPIKINLNDTSLQLFQGQFPPNSLTVPRPYWGCAFPGESE